MSAGRARPQSDAASDARSVQRTLQGLSARGPGHLAPVRPVPEETDANPGNGNGCGERLVGIAPAPEAAAKR